MMLPKTLWITVVVLGVATLGGFPAQAYTPPPALQSFCGGNDGLNLLDGMFGAGVSVTCNKSDEHNAWTYLGKDFDEWVWETDRAGLLARADIDYCLLREMDDVQVDLSEKVKYLGRFGVRPEIQIYEYNPAPDDRYVKGFLDLYVYVFGLKAALQRQYFEVRFPRNAYPEWRLVDMPVFDWESGRVTYYPTWMKDENHSTYLLSRSIDGEKSVTIDIPIIGELLRVRLDDTERQIQRTPDLLMQDWLWFQSFTDKLIGQNGFPTALASHNTTAFPSAWVGGWWTDVPDVHQDYTKSYNGMGVPQEITWSNEESFSATGIFEGGVGAVINALTGANVPGWVDELLSLIEIDIHLGVGFTPGSELSLLNYVTTPPYPPQDPDAHYEALTDVIRDHVELDGLSYFDVDPIFNITITLNLLFIHPSWTWHVPIPKLTTSHSDSLAEARVDVHRDQRKDGRAADYQFIKLPRKGKHYYNADAKEWIDACLSKPAQVEEPAPPELPVLTSDLPKAPRVCLVEAFCETRRPNFKVCLCENENNIDWNNCWDTSGQDPAELDLLNETLGGACGG